MRWVFTVIRLLVVSAGLAGAPMLLWLVLGDPLPSRPPSMAEIQSWANDPVQLRFVAPVVRASVWLLWLTVSGVVLASAVSKVRHRRWSRLAGYLPGPMQGLAAALLGAATVSAAPGVPVHATTDAGMSQPQPASGTAGEQSGQDRSPAPVVTPAPGAGAGQVLTGSVVASRAAAPTHTVKRGDTLSSIAAQRLGDADRWPEIFALNRGTRFPRIGGTLRDADVIYPGWRLALPGKTRAAEPPAPTPTAPTTGAAAPQQAPSGTSPATDTGTATSPTHAPTAAGSARDTLADDTTDAEGQQNAPAGIELESGSWVEAGLAAALTAAAALVWRHRRRRYTRRPVSADLRLDDPDMAAMPAVIAQIRRRLRDGRTTDTGTAATGTPVRSAPPTHTVSTGGVDPSPLVEQRDIRITEQIAAPPTRETDTVPRRRVVPTSTNPATVWRSAGLGLAGPGAAAAARGFLAAALADQDPDVAPGLVMMPSTTAATLLGAAAAALPTTPRLVVTDNLTDALELLEQQILHRSRLAYAHEVDTVAAMRAADPYEEPTPPLLLIADAGNDHERARLTALLAQGHSLDVHGILLGDWPAGDTIVVAADGTTTPGDSSRHGRHPADVGRLTVLTADETAAIITTLAEAHSGLPPQPTPTEPLSGPRTDHRAPASSATADAVGSRDDANRVLDALAELGDATAAAIAAHLGLPYPAATAKLVQWEHTGHAETIRTATGQTLWRLTHPGRPGLRRPRPNVAAKPAKETSDPADRRHDEISTALRWPDPATTFTSEPVEPPAQNTDDSGEKPGRVEVTVLGEAGIVATAPDRRPRRKALELLVYLAVHDGSATVEAILDDLMPEAPASKAPERLHTYVSDLRSVMRRIGGPATYLTHPHHRYTLNPDAIGVDLWRMRAAIRQAHQTDDPRERIDALQQAVDAYRGPLADGADYEWAEPYREAIRQQALDAHLALADALTGDPTAQARVLETAIGHSPYSEHLYQQAMRARAALGHLDSIRTLRRALDRALAEIDAEPGDDTITLADELIADLQRPGRRTDIETTSGSN